MIIKTTSVFDKWFENLRDRQIKVKVRGRIERAALGNFGDYKSVGGGVSEMRINYGPGYRLYYTKRGEEIILLLVGGNKGTQQADIAKAHEILKELKG